MKAAHIINILKSYPFCDIERGNTIIRRQLPTDELDEGLLESYTSAYGKIKIIPKRMSGNSPIRIQDEAVELSASDFPKQYSQGLNGFDSQPSQGGSGELYKIMYENARAEASEYKQKYEAALNDKHKAELEMVGNKSNWLEHIGPTMGTLGAVLLNGGAPAGMGSIPQQPVSTPAPANLQPVDPQLKAIITYYNKLDADNKQKVYTLLAKVFTDLGRIDDVLDLLN